MSASAGRPRSSSVPPEIQRMGIVTHHRKYETVRDRQENSSSGSVRNRSGSVHVQTAQGSQSIHYHNNNGSLYISHVRPLQ
jgi:hypothetical protein